MSTTSIVSIALASLQAGIAAALGAQVAGFSLPPAVIFGLVVAASMLAVVTANLPAVALRSAAPSPPAAPSRSFEPRPS